MTDANDDFAVLSEYLGAAKERLRARIWKAYWEGHVNSPEEQRRLVDTYFSGNGPRYGDEK